MKRIFYILLLLTTGLLLNSCQKYLSPEPDNRLTEEEMLANPAYWEGLLLEAYGRLPGNYNFNEDVASDDAVTNDKNSGARRLATGEWSSSFYPFNKWNSSYGAIFYINSFLEKFRQVQWSWESSQVDRLHRQRLDGEAHGLRAWFELTLLQHHGGKASDGSMLGVPIVTKMIDMKDFQIPRASLQEYVDQIMSDLDTAIANLPAYYEDQGDDVEYNEAMGSRFVNRFMATAARALKSRAALLAASPAYGYMSWEDAATIAGDLIRDNGGLTVLSPTGEEYYKDYNDPENIWYKAFSQSSSLEEANFPPSQYGNGNTNPTQELINTFPMANGYPINDPGSGYDPGNPYQNRDPRLSKYIIYNGNTLKNNTINTYVGAPSDGINNLVTSTRTGYYLKKFMNESVNLVPGSVKQASHFFTYIRWTEIVLNYAEAANEAWGPDGDPMGYGFTARDAIAAVRQRAGINPDNYLAGISTQEDMRTLIRNERRIELCFEGFRFWDIRRWRLTETMKAPVSAMFIDYLNPGFHYDIQKVEDRIYKDYMIYGPIPYNETLKYNIRQNKGW